MQFSNEISLTNYVLYLDLIIEIGDVKGGTWFKKGFGTVTLERGPISIVDVSLERVMIPYS